MKHIDLLIIFHILRINKRDGQIYPLKIYLLIKKNTSITKNNSIPLNFRRKRICIISTVIVILSRITNEITQFFEFPFISNIFFYNFSHFSIIDLYIYIIFNLLVIFIYQFNICNNFIIISIEEILFN